MFNLSLEIIALLYIFKIIIKVFYTNNKKIIYVLTLINLYNICNFSWFIYRFKHNKLFKKLLNEINLFK